MCKCVVRRSPILTPLYFLAQIASCLRVVGEISLKYLQTAAILALSRKNWQTHQRTCIYKSVEMKL